MATEQPQGPPEPSIRGLTEGDRGPQTPLRKFRGILDSYQRDTDSFNNVRVNLNIREVQVVESVEPYIFPTATIRIKESNRKASAWGIFSKSLTSLIPDDEDLKNQLNKPIGLEWTGGHDLGFKDRETQQPVVIEAWSVFEVAGKAVGTEGLSVTDELKKLMENKTQAEFNAAAYSSPTVKAAGADAIAMITDKSFITAMLATEFTQDANGVFHRKEAATPPPATT